MLLRMYHVTLKQKDNFIDDRYLKIMVTLHLLRHYGKLNISS